MERYTIVYYEYKVNTGFSDLQLIVLLFGQITTLHF